MVIVEKDICCSGTRDPEGPMVAANIRVILARRRSERGGDVARRFIGFGLIRRDPTGGVEVGSPVASGWPASCPV
jgi:hypothetical protein